MRQFYKGGFLPEMTRREAALILGGGGLVCTCAGQVLSILSACPSARPPPGNNVSDLSLTSPSGIRESAAEAKVKEAHRRIMIANHPDAGGSSYIATKVNEAKDMLVGKKRSGSSMF